MKRVCIHVYAQAELHLSHLVFLYFKKYDIFMYGGEVKVEFCALKLKTQRVSTHSES